MVIKMSTNKQHNTLACLDGFVLMLILLPPSDSSHSHESMRVKKVEVFPISIHSCHINSQSEQCKLRNYAGVCGASPRQRRAARPRPCLPRVRRVRRPHARQLLRPVHLRPLPTRGRTRARTGRLSQLARTREIVDMAGEKGHGAVEKGPGLLAGAGPRKQPGQVPRVPRGAG
jgi:hypothetical protein